MLTHATSLAQFVPTTLEFHSDGAMCLEVPASSPAARWCGPFRIFLAGGSRDKRGTSVVFSLLSIEVHGARVRVPFFSMYSKVGYRNKSGYLLILHTSSWHVLDCICNRLHRPLTCSGLAIRTLMVFLGGW